MVIECKCVLVCILWCLAYALIQCLASLTCASPFLSSFISSTDFIANGSCFFYCRLWSCSLNPTHGTNLVMACDMPAWDVQWLAPVHIELVCQLVKPCPVILQWFGVHIWSASVHVDAGCGWCFIGSNPIIYTHFLTLFYFSCCSTSLNWSCKAMVAR